VVILSVLDMVPAHNFNFSKVGILLPLRRIRKGRLTTTTTTMTYIEKVDLFEELLFMVLEFADHGGKKESYATCGAFNRLQLGITWA
jgi:hypothetical protein